VTARAGSDLLDRQDGGVDGHAADQEGSTVRVRDDSRVVGYEVPLVPPGWPAGRGWGLVVVTAKVIRLLQPGKAGSPTSAPALGGIGVASRRKSRPSPATTPTLGGIGVASRPGSRPSPATPRHDQPV